MTKSLQDLPEGEVHLEEKKVTSKLVHDGIYLKMYQDQVSLPNGNLAIREYLEHPGAVAIVPMFDDGSILMERQYRYPLSRAILEIPAGKLDVGEDPLECAKRELKEETGFEADEWILLGRIHPVISYSTEFIDIYLAKGLHQGNAQLDDEEFLDIFKASMEDIHSWILNGKISDVKTIISHYWLKDYFLKQKDCDQFSTKL